MPEYNFVHVYKCTHININKLPSYITITKEICSSLICKTLQKIWIIGPSYASNRVFTFQICSNAFFHNRWHSNQQSIIYKKKYKAKKYFWKYASIATTLTGCKNVMIQMQHVYKEQGLSGIVILTNKRSKLLRLI